MSAEPYGAEEIAAVEREFADIARTQPLASGAMAIRLFETAARLLATVRAREAERDEARRIEQDLRDAMYHGHAGHSCKQIGEMADRALASESSALEQRDRAREEARLWRGLALASWKPEHWGRDKYDTARDALRAAGIDPDAPEGI